MLVLVHELGHFFAAKLSGVWVREFSIGWPPHILSIQYGETTYKVGLLPLGGYVSMYGEDGNGLDEKNSSVNLTGRSYREKNALQRIFIVSAGVCMNYLTALVIIGVLLIVQGKGIVSVGIAVDEVFDGGPAQQAGLEAGDIILSYQDSSEEYVEIGDVQDFITATNESLGESFNVKVADSLSAEVVREVAVTPKDFYKDGKGTLGFRISTEYNIEYTDVSLTQVPGEAFKETFHILGLMLTGIRDIVSGLFVGETPADVAGPVGVASLSGSAARQGILSFMQFLAIISLNLAVVNLLPFPALDGGRLVFIFLEIVLRRSLDNSFQRMIHIAGMVVLLLLMAVVTYYDIARF